MAEEQFTSRRARREAERLAAEQAFEARETPEQPEDPAPTSRADLLTPPPVPPAKPNSAPGKAESTSTEAASASAETAESVPEETAAADPMVEADESTSRIDPNPAPSNAHERGSLASDHPVESRPPVNAEDRLDPQRAPLPHFDSRAERKRYLREHGLSLGGDLSTGALPVIADPDEIAGSDEFAATDETDHESYDTAGFGGDADEVAARDFESPVTPESAPRPTQLDDEARGSRPEDEPDDALSAPIEIVEAEEADEAEQGDEAETTSAADEHDDAVESDSVPDADPDTDPSADDSAQPSASAPDDDATITDSDSRSRKRRMPIVAPPTTSGVRVVTAASAKIPDPEPEGSSDDSFDSSDVNAAPAPGLTDRADADADADVDGDHDHRDGSVSESAVPGHETEDHSAEGTSDSVSPDDAARALAANPETRPMDTVPEAWALPNSDYEDEETENPPGTRIRASAVTGNDGKILVGEEPSKMPYIVLGVAALFAIGLIVVALAMLL